MKHRFFTILACLWSLTGTASVLQNDPDALPPTGGPGWYSTAGSTVRYYAEYGPAQGFEEPFAGVLLEARDIVVDHFTNVVRTWDGNDALLHFDCILSATLVRLLDDPVPAETTVSIRGAMVVRLAGKKNKTVGTFPLTVESMLFTLTVGDLFAGGGTEPFFSIRNPATPVSTGRTIVSDAGGGMYLNDTTLNVHSEAALYSSELHTYLPYWPDTRQPTPYEILPLQGPRNPTVTVGADLELSFPMRPGVLYTVYWSENLVTWQQVTTRKVEVPFETGFSYIHAVTPRPRQGWFRVLPAEVPLPP